MNLTNHCKNKELEIVEKASNFGASVVKEYESFIRSQKKGVLNVAFYQGRNF